MPNTSFVDIPILRVALLLSCLFIAAAKAETKEPGTLDIELDAAELKKRAETWKAPPMTFTNGALWKYANEVGPARTGAVTHPGGSVEVACYADV